MHDKKWKHTEVERNHWRTRSIRWREEVKLVLPDDSVSISESTSTLLPWSYLIPPRLHPTGSSKFAGRPPISSSSWPSSRGVASTFPLSEYLNPSATRHHPRYLPPQIQRYRLKFPPMFETLRTKLTGVGKTGDIRVSSRKAGDGGPSSYALDEGMFRVGAPNLPRD